jgi:hypothetical protein
MLLRAIEELAMSVFMKCVVVKALFYKPGG